MYEPNIRVLTEEEQAEARRQKGLPGVKLSKHNKYYCEKKLADTCQHIFYDNRESGRCGIDEGKFFIEIYSLNLERMNLLASRSSDSSFHKFLQDCYDAVCKIHEKRLEAAVVAVKTEEDFLKLREDALRTLEKNLSEMRADQQLAQSQKLKRPGKPFDKGDLKTWCSLSFEDAQDSKDRLVEKKVALLKKINE
ncbi:MAG TPA: hypothetical protein VMW78_03775 [Anaerolineae bacterium]|nr:hypothetical protein [Anaerolineae bacterium]